MVSYCPIDLAFLGVGTLVCGTMALIAGSVLCTCDSVCEGTFAWSVALSYVLDDESCDISALANMCRLAVEASDVVREPGEVIG